MDWANPPSPSHLSGEEWANILPPLTDDNTWEYSLDELNDLPPFAYEPLVTSQREIRILYLCGSRNSDGIPRGVLSNEAWDFKPPYVALSYVWGDPKEMLPIVINDGVFLVGVNLYSALEHLRQQIDARVLPIWIDAICINQTDNVEKGHQVQMMGEIYASSIFTLSWLGPEVDDSDLAIKVLDYISEQCVSHPDGPAVEERRHLFTRILPTPGMGEFPTAAIIALFTRPYWRRIWIVQEVILPPAVYVICGSAVTPFHAIGLGILALLELLALNTAVCGVLTTRIQALLEIPSKCEPGLVQAAMSSVASKIKAPLAKRLLDVPRMGATNPLDHIYGLLGLVSDWKTFGIKVDYDTTPSALFTDVTAALLRQGNQYLLSQACGAAKMVGGMAVPSWVVNWSRDDTKERALIRIWNAKHKLYNSGGRSGWPYSPPSVEDRGRRLRLEGAVVDVIETLGPPPAQETEQARSYLASLETFAHTSCASGYDTYARLQEAIHRLALLDCEVALFSNTGRYNRRGQHDVLRGYYRGMQKQAAELGAAVPNVSMHASAIMAHVGKQLFATTKGQIGLGPPDLRLGDMVCVFRGCDVPFVLRPMNGVASASIVDTKGRRLWSKRPLYSCVLIGETFVQGIMDGEGLTSGGKADFVLH